MEYVYWVLNWGKGNALALPQTQQTLLPFIFVTLLDVGIFEQVL